MKIITHHQFVPRLINTGAIPPHPTPAYGLHRGRWISVANNLCASYLNLLAYFGTSILNRINQSRFGDRLPTGRYGVRNPVEKRDFSHFSNVQHSCGDNELPIQLEPEFFSRGKGVDVRLTTHLHLLQWLRICGATPRFIVYALMEWTGKSLPIFTLNRMTTFLADELVSEYLLLCHICEFRTHEYYVGPMKCKSAISSHNYTTPSVTYLQVTTEGLIKVFCHFTYCFLH